MTKRGKSAVARSIAFDRHDWKVQERDDRKRREEQGRGHSKMPIIM